MQERRWDDEIILIINLTQRNPTQPPPISSLCKQRTIYRDKVNATKHNAGLILTHITNTTVAGQCKRIRRNRHLLELVDDGPRNGVPAARKLTLDLAAGYGEQEFLFIVSQGNRFRVQALDKCQQLLIKNIANKVGFKRH